MSQTVCQTASVDQTGELSQAVGHNTTIGDEANAGTDAARQLVLWELGRQQVTVDFSAGNIVTRDPSKGKEGRATGQRLRHAFH